MCCISILSYIYCIIRIYNTCSISQNFWESAACFSADVARPETTYPRGMLVAMLLVFFFSFFPVLVGIGISNEPYTGKQPRLYWYPITSHTRLACTYSCVYIEWTDGHFVHLASLVGGRWLGAFMLVGAAISSVGMFEAEMSSDAWQVLVHILLSCILVCIFPTYTCSICSVYNYQAVYVYSYRYYDINMCMDMYIIVSYDHIQICYIILQICGMAEDGTLPKVRRIVAYVKHIKPNSMYVSLYVV